MRIIIVPKRVSSPSVGEGGLRGVHFDLLAFIRTGFYPVPLIAGLDTGLQSKAQARGPATAGTAKPFWSSRAACRSPPLMVLLSSRAPGSRVMVSPGLPLKPELLPELPSRMPRTWVQPC